MLMIPNPSWQDKCDQIYVVALQLPSVRYVGYGYSNEGPYVCISGNKYNPQWKPDIDHLRNYIPSTIKLLVHDTFTD